MASTGRPTAMGIINGTDSGGPLFRVPTRHEMRDSRRGPLLPRLTAGPARAVPCILPVVRSPLAGVCDTRNEHYEQRR